MASAAKRDVNRRGRPRLPEDQRAADTIQLRVTRRRKASYKRAARRARKTLTAWATHHLDRAAGQERGSPPGSVQASGLARGSSPGARCGA